MKDYNPYVDHPTWQQCKYCGRGNNWATCEACYNQKIAECEQSIIVEEEQ